MVDAGSRMAGMVNRALRMMAGTLASRVLGLAREVLTASLFGATRHLDAFYVAYTLANLSRQLLAEGALSASFVPVFSRALARDGRDGARSLARQTLTILVGACAVVVAVGIAASPILVRVIAPGFGPEEAGLATMLTRAMFPFLLLVSVGALAMGVLNSIGSFFVPAIAPAASNLTFIAILILFSSGSSVWTMVAAVLAGGAASTAIQWLWSARMGMALVPARPDMADPDLRETLRLFVPYAAGLSLNQINPLISRMLGSFLEGGVISALTYADRLIQLPLGLFVIAISQAVLPMLSRIDRSDTATFAEFVRDALRFDLFAVLPAALGLVLLSRPIVHILLMRGAFDEWALAATSGALACYAAGLPGMACSTVVMRALYARGLARQAVIVTAFTVVSNLALGTALMQFMSYRGLALGTSIAFTCAACLGAILLARDLGVRLRIFEPLWLVRQTICCELYFLGLYFVVNDVPYPAAAPFAHRAIWVTAVVAIGSLLYFALTMFAKCPEWRWIGGAVRRRRAHGQDGDQDV